MDPLRSRSSQRWVLLAVAAALAGLWVGVQGWLLQARWINPDEGAHLMDAQLAMQGLIPMVDFQSRQPVYVYAYVPFLHWLGGSYLAGRLMPLLATALGGWVLFLIGRRLWNSTVGAAAAVLSLASPTMFINASVVKTEPLAILLTALGLYGVIRYLQERSWWPLLLAGVMFSLGYYVRQSTLGGLLAGILLLLGASRGGLKSRLATLGLLLLGFGAFWAVAAVVYWRFVPLERLLSSEGFSPLQMVKGALIHMAGWGRHVESKTAGELVREAAQTWTWTKANLTDALRLNIHLLVGTFLAVGWWGWTALEARRGERRDTSSLGFRAACAWLASMTLLYTYYFLHRGFFQFYFRELIPPMALLTAVVTVELVRRLGWQRHASWVTPMAVLAAAGLFLMQRVARGGSGVLLALLMTGALGWLVAVRQRPGMSHAPYLMGWAGVLFGTVLVRFGWGGAVLQHLNGVWVVGVGIAILSGLLAGARHERSIVCSFAALAVLLSSVAWTVSHSAKILSPAYDCVWSPATVRDAAALVRAHSAAEDEVLSGGLIWEVEAGRRPFMTISHPLIFMDRMPAEQVEAIRARLRTHPPKVIVLDGYTERTYGRRIPEFASLIPASYDVIAEVDGSRYPVKVCVRRPSGATDGLATLRRGE